jgi:hypothetical protein
LGLRAQPGMYEAFAPTRLGAALDGMYGTLVPEDTIEKLRAREREKKLADVAAAHREAPSVASSFQRQDATALKVSGKIRSGRPAQTVEHFTMFSDGQFDDGTGSFQANLRKDPGVYHPSLMSTRARLPTQTPKPARTGWRTGDTPPIFEEGGFDPEDEYKFPMASPTSAAQQMSSREKRDDMKANELHDMMRQVMRNQASMQEEVGARFRLMEKALGEVGPTGRSSTSTRRRKVKPIKYYAVSKGLNPGIYEGWSGPGGARKQTKGVKGARYRYHSSRETAEMWLEAEREMSSAASGPSSSSESDSDRSEPEKPSRKSVPRGYLSFPLSSVDESTGVPGEVFGFPLKSEPELLAKLCPKGMSTQMQNDLAAATMDAVSLPGTYNPSENSQNLVDLAGAIRDASTGTKSRGPLRDTQWKMKGRNALAKATSADELVELISELRSIRSATLDGMYLDMRGSLVPLGWDKDRIDLYLHVSRLPYMARRTLELYTDLLSHLQSIANALSGGWVLAKVDLDWYAKEFLRIRTAAPTRLLMIAHTYAFLRDVSETDFASQKLQESRYKHTMSLFASHSLTVSTGQVATGTPPKPTMCSHCRHKTFHAGGFPFCFWKDISSNLAKAAAQEVTTKMAADPTQKVMVLILGSLTSRLG